MRIQELPPLFRNPDIRPSSTGSEKTDLSRDPQLKSADGDALDVSLSSKITKISEEVAATLSESNETLESDRLQEINARIQSGFYHQRAVGEAVANSLVAFYGR